MLSLKKSVDFFLKKKYIKSYVANFFHFTFTKEAISIEKRFFLILLMVFSLVLIVNHDHAYSSKQLPLDQVKKSNAFLEAKNKIQGEAKWKPLGFGSGEYLTTLPKIDAGAVIDSDSREVLWSMNLKKKIAPASLAKIATVMTAMDISNLEKTLVVSPEAADQIPTKLGLRAGERLILKEAITASILTSANDATETISDYFGNELGNGTSIFMDLVNIKLNKIGAYDSHFETSTGLDGDNHYTTVFDLAIMAHEAKENYPFISEIASKDYVKLEANSDHKLFDLPNWNALLGTYPGVDGLKIGYTEKAGHATIVTAKRDGHELIAIVIGADSLEDRETAAAILLNYGFEKYNIEPFPIWKLDLTRRFEDWRRELTN